MTDEVHRICRQCRHVNRFAAEEYARRQLLTCDDCGVALLTPALVAEPSEAERWQPYLSRLRRWV